MVKKEEEKVEEKVAVMVEVKPEEGNKVDKKEAVKMEETTEV